MSKYTTEVRFICETEYGLNESKGYASVDTILNNVHSKIFDFEYPIFDTDYKKTLETKILKHYYTREIGEETVGLWKLRLNAKMNEIMPYFNQLYKSTLLEIDPLVNHVLEKEHKGNDTNEFKNANNGSNADNDNRIVKDNNDGYSMYSDTPQGSLNGVRDENYLTNATHNTDTSNTETTDNRTSTYNNNASGWATNVDEYLEKYSGNMGASQSKLLMEYRKTFLNIDMQIIDELEVLFMQLW